MPIYEFYCEPCHTIFNFLSNKVDTEKVPACPRCGNPRLIRKVSLPAIISGGLEKKEDGENLPSIDEIKMENAMHMLAQEAEHINEDDPRQAANLMRKLSEVAGVSLGPGMEEALHRLEKGEDPEKIEDELGDLLEEEPFLLEKKSGAASKKHKPEVDETLYEL